MASAPDLLVDTIRRFEPTILPSESSNAWWLQSQCEQMRAYSHLSNGSHHLFQGRRQQVSLCWHCTGMILGDNTDRSGSSVVSMVVDCFFLCGSPAELMLLHPDPRVYCSVSFAMALKLSFPLVTTTNQLAGRCFSPPLSVVPRGVSRTAGAATL